MHPLTLLLSITILFFPSILAQVPPLPEVESPTPQPNLVPLPIPHLPIPLPDLPNPQTMDIQYSTFPHTTCMSNGGPIFTSKPGKCIKLHDTDQGIRVYPTAFHGQCKLRTYASRDCSGPGGKWIGIGVCNPLRGGQWSLKVVCPLVKT